MEINERLKLATELHDRIEGYVAEIDNIATEMRKEMTEFLTEKYVGSVLKNELGTYFYQINEIKSVEYPHQGYGGWINCGKTYRITVACTVLSMTSGMAEILEDDAMMLDITDSGTIVDYYPSSVSEFENMRDMPAPFRDMDGNALTKFDAVCLIEDGNMVTGSINCLHPKDMTLDIIIDGGRHLLRRGNEVKLFR